MFHQLVHLRSVSPEGMTCVECKCPSIIQYYNYHCIAVVMWSPVLVVLIMWCLIVKLATTLPLLYYLIPIYIHLVWGIVSLMMECMIQGVWGIGGTAWNENSDLILVRYDMRIKQQICTSLTLFFIIDTFGAEGQWKLQVLWIWV